MTSAVLFFDLEDFTSVSAHIGKERTLSLLNMIIPTIMKIVKHYDGVVEKNTGDGLMAILGTETPSDLIVARDAIECAMSIRKTVIDYVYPHLAQDDLPIMKFRIGVDMGEILVSRIGL